MICLTLQSCFCSPHMSDTYCSCSHSATSHMCDTYCSCSHSATSRRQHAGHAPLRTRVLFLSAMVPGPRRGSSVHRPVPLRSSLSGCLALPGCPCSQEVKQAIADSSRHTPCHFIRQPSPDVCGSSRQWQAVAGSGRQ